MLFGIAIHFLMLWSAADATMQGSSSILAQRRLEDKDFPSSVGCVNGDGDALPGACTGKKEDECRRELDCKWISACPEDGERPINLFGKSPGEDFCRFLKEETQCQQSYRRSPRGKKARLCYWDSLKGKCKGGDRYNVETTGCTTLPAATKRKATIHSGMVPAGPHTETNYCPHEHSKHVQNQDECIVHMATTSTSNIEFPIQHGGVSYDDMGFVLYYGVCWICGFTDDFDEGDLFPDAGVTTYVLA